MTFFHGKSSVSVAFWHCHVRSPVIWHTYDSYGAACMAYLPTNTGWFFWENVASILAPWSTRVTYISVCLFYKYLCIYVCVYCYNNNNKKSKSNNNCYYCYCFFLLLSLFLSLSLLPMYDCQLIYLSIDLSICIQWQWQNPPWMALGEDSRYPRWMANLLLKHHPW